jgi:hypothetical protein
MNSLKVKAMDKTLDLVESEQFVENCLLQEVRSN